MEVKWELGSILALTVLFYFLISFFQAMFFPEISLIQGIASVFSNLVWSVILSLVVLYLVKNKVLKG